jgi:hypothetical protein
MGVANVNVVLASGGVTVLACPPPLRVIELNRAGWLTLMVAEPILSATLRSLRTVNVPALTVAPGAPTLDTDVLLTSAPKVAAGVGVGGLAPTVVAVAVGFTVAVAVGFAVAVAVGFAVAVAVGFAVTVAVGFAVAVAVGFVVAVAVGFAVAVTAGLAVAVAVGLAVAVAVGLAVAVAVSVGVLVGVGVAVAPFKAPKVTVKASG